MYRQKSHSLYSRGLGSCTLFRNFVSVRIFVRIFMCYTVTMIFDGFIGQSYWQTYFTTILQERRYAHAYLFSGPRHLGKRTFVDLFGRALLCHNLTAKGVCGQCDSCRSWRGGEHPDLLRLKLAADASHIGVDEARDFIASIQQTPFTAHCRVAIIEDADFITIEGLNALLKTLEEPAQTAILLLVSESAENLPATVRSRLQHCLFSTVPRQTLIEWLTRNGLDRARAAELAALSNGRPGLIFQWRENLASLKAYETEGQRFLELCGESLKERFAFSENIFGSTESSPSNLNDVLSHWRLILRDLLMLRANEPSLISHVFLRPNFDEIVKKYDSLEWLAKYQSLEWLEWLIGRNANRRLALNNFLINL